MFVHVVSALLAMTGYCWGCATAAGPWHTPPRLVDIVAVSGLALGAAWTLDAGVGIFAAPLAAVIGLLVGLPIGRLTRRHRRRYTVMYGPPPSGWRARALAAGALQARIFLALFYFIVVAPFALIVRFSRDPLVLAHRRAASYWIPRSTAVTDLPSARRLS